MQHFKSVTLATALKGFMNAVVMGRKTWESIPEKFRPLANRLNVVLTRNKDSILPAGVLRASSFAKALELLGTQDKKIDHIFIIGGASVYQEAIVHPFCQKIYVTKVQGDFSCDTFFPEFKSTFKEIECSSSCCECGKTYSFSVYARA